jgi:hypothetical protein
VSLPGTLAVANVEDRTTGDVITVVSIYGSWEKPAGGGAAGSTPTARSIVVVGRWTLDLDAQPQHGILHLHVLARGYEHTGEGRRVEFLAHRFVNEQEMNGLRHE